MRTLLTLLALGGLVPLAHAQLRPRRVGVNTAGEQTGVDAGEALGAGMGGAESMLDALDGMDPTELLGEMMKNNPMMQGLQEMPEMAKLMTDPAALKAKMSEMAELLSSDEGRKQMEEAQNAMKEFLTDPQKMREGLEQLKTNPMLKGLTDSLPEEVKQMLNNPELLEPALEEMTRSFGDMASGAAPDFGKMASMLNNLLPEDAQQMLAEGLGGLGGLDGEALGGGDDLQGRVREQLASMLRDRDAADMLNEAEDF